MAVINVSLDLLNLFPHRIDHYHLPGSRAPTCEIFLRKIVINSFFKKCHRGIS